MSIESRIIDAIKAEMMEFANDALTKPARQGEMGFEYGNACGTYSGLVRALDIIKRVLEEEDAEGHGRLRRAGYGEPLIDS